MDIFYKVRDFSIPDYMAGGIKRYIEDGIPPGDFLSAIITNDLRTAVFHADDYNIRNIPAYIFYFYNEVPSTCWGSVKSMSDWIKIGGLNGTKKSR